MQGFVALFLSRPLLEAGPLASQSQLNDVLLRIETGAFAAYLDDSFHVAPLGSDQAPRHLKLLIVVYLNVESARILYVVVLIPGCIRPASRDHADVLLVRCLRGLETRLKQALLAKHVLERKLGLRDGPLGKIVGLLLLLLREIRVRLLLLLLYGLLLGHRLLLYHACGCVFAWRGLVLLDDPFHSEGGIILAKVEIVE